MRLKCPPSPQAKIRRGQAGIDLDGRVIAAVVRIAEDQINTEPAMQSFDACRRAFREAGERGDQIQRQRQTSSQIAKSSVVREALLHGGQGLSFVTAGQKSDTHGEAREIGLQEERVGPAFGLCLEDGTSQILLIVQ